MVSLLGAHGAGPGAGGWGSHFVDAGPLGHINALSGIADWAEGRMLLAELIDGAGLAHTPTQGRALFAARLSPQEPRAAV